MARSRASGGGGGESKAPLVIAMVFFILTSIGLGVWAYLQQAEIATAKDAEAKAKQEQQAESKRAGEEAEKGKLYRAAIGVATPDDWESLKAPKYADALKLEHDKLVDQVNAQLKAAVGGEQKTVAGQGGPGLQAVQMRWDMADGKALAAAPTPGTLVDWLVKAEAKRELEYLKADTEKKNAAAAKAQADAARAEYDLARDNLKKAIDAIPAAIKAEVDKDVATLKQRIADFEKVAVATRGEKKELGEQKLALEAAVDQLSKKYENVNDKYTRLSRETEDKEDPFPSDTPQARVVVRRSGSNVVEIDVGSADNVRPGLTFNVQPADALTKGLQARLREVTIDGKKVMRVVPKGTVEVTAVLGEHLSSARITGGDADQEPIGKHDLLYNAAWKKGAADHVVLYGVFDTDADGQDDVRSVVKRLTGMGVIVDGYFDLATKKWVGDGPGQRTTFAVRGLTPAISAGDALQGAKGELITAINAAEQQARDKGAKVVRYRDFFPRIGYKVRYDVSDDTVNTAAAKFLRPGGDAPPAGDKPTTPTPEK